VKDIVKSTAALLFFKMSMCYEANCTKSSEKH